MTPPTLNDVETSAGLHRRDFLAASATGLAGIVLASSLGQGAPVDSGKAEAGKVTFPTEIMPSDPSAGAPDNPFPVDQRVGFAVVDLGRLAVNHIIPAFGSSKNARLVALVSGTPDKANLLASQYGVKPGSVYPIKEWREMDRVYWE